MQQWKLEYFYFKWDGKKLKTNKYLADFVVFMVEETHDNYFIIFCFLISNQDKQVCELGRIQDHNNSRESNSTFTHIESNGIQALEANATLLPYTFIYAEGIKC